MAATVRMEPAAQPARPAETVRMAIPAASAASAERKAPPAKLRSQLAVAAAAAVVVTATPCPSVIMAATDPRTAHTVPAEPAARAAQGMAAGYMPARAPS